MQRNSGGVAFSVRAADATTSGAQATGRVQRLENIGHTNQPTYRDDLAFRRPDTDHYPVPNSEFRIRSAVHEKVQIGS